MTEQQKTERKERLKAELAKEIVGSLGDTTPVDNVIALLNNPAYRIARAKIPRAKRKNAA